jgi:SAM-dependent methyltransferase
MADEDGHRWNARYEGQPVAEPSPPDALTAAGLVDILGDSGRALDVACGSGGQTVWLAQRGFDVVAVDASDVAVRLTAAAATAGGVADQVDALVIDLDAGVPLGLGDFDVIVCQRFRGIALYDTFVNRLMAGGLAVVTVLSETGAASPGPFHAPSGELLRAFTRSDTEILFHTESDGQESLILRRP